MEALKLVLWARHLPVKFDFPSPRRRANLKAGNMINASRGRFSVSRTAIALGAAAAVFVGGMVGAPNAIAQSVNVEVQVGVPEPDTTYVYLLDDEGEVVETLVEGADGAWVLPDDSEIAEGDYTLVHSATPGEPVATDYSEEVTIDDLQTFAVTFTYTEEDDDEPGNGDNSNGDNGNGDNDNGDNDNGNGEDEDLSSQLSSNFDFDFNINEPEDGGLSDRCIGTGLAVGLPLLLLVPAGLAGQLGIAGSSALMDPVNAAIQDANTQIQNQIGLLDPNAAQAVEDLNAMLAPFGVTAGQAAIGVGMVAAGVAGTAAILDACTGGNGSSATVVGWLERDSE